MKSKQPSLLFCVIMDLLGYASYALPVLGELTDIIWAPFSAMVFFFAFSGWKGGLGSLFNFLEELGPGTDFIPSFSLMYLVRGMEPAASFEQVD